MKKVLKRVKGRLEVDTCHGKCLWFHPSRGLDSAVIGTRASKKLDGLRAEMVISVEEKKK
jgi:hypothetical protein